MEPTEQLLEHLNSLIDGASTARAKRIALSKEYWGGKPRTLLNERLSRIEINKHQAQFTLETAPIMAEREVLLDALTRAEMLKPALDLMGRQA